MVVIDINKVAKIIAGFPIGCLMAEFLSLFTLVVSFASFLKGRSDLILGSPADSHTLHDSELDGESMEDLWVRPWGLRALGCAIDGE